MPVKIIIVEDHDIFREGIKYVLKSDPQFDIVGEASNGKLFLNLLKKGLPDVVLMDIDMPVMNGIEATREALKNHPELNILTLSMHGDQGHYQQMIEAGARGFVLKSAGIHQLSEAIRLVVQGQVYFSNELLMNIIQNKENTNPNNLLQQLEISPREMEVLQHTCKGLSNQQIADEMYISVKTVEGHKSKLMTKTNTSSTLSLVLYAIKNKLTTP